MSDSSKVLAFASSELRQYLRKMTGVAPSVSVISDSSNHVLLIGGGPTHNRDEAPAVIDQEWDDAFTIRVRDKAGYIAGSNARSVLFGVYRLLESCGCRWLRPGHLGEVVPQVDNESIAAEIEEIASLRHRALCIEGAVGTGHLRDMIDFAAKLTFNGYFLQFLDGDGELYAERWRLSGGKSSGDSLYEIARSEIRRRGLNLHAGGHGWTSSALGLPEFLEDGLRPDDRVTFGLAAPDRVSIPAEMAHLSAEIDGVRELWRGVPSNTNLCYSNPQARRRYVDQVIRQLETIPDVEVLHLWLADDFNNHCECSRCQLRRPADWYVALLNEIDEALTALGKATRLGCLAYLDLLWAPEYERLHHPDRFVFTFAPITRTYAHPFPSTTVVGDEPPYERNRLRLPTAHADHEAHLGAWLQQGPLQTATYEYHLYRNQYYDLGTLGTASVMFQDINNLIERGIDGYIGCQSPRSAFPTGFSLFVQGRTLWDNQATYVDLQKYYFGAAFGSHADLVLEFLHQVGAGLPAAYLNGEGVDRSRLAANVEELVTSCEDFTKLAQTAIDNLSGTHQLSWEIIDAACRLYVALCRIVLDRLSDRLERALAVWSELRRELLTSPEPLASVLDTFLFVRELDLVFGSRQEPPALRLEGDLAR